MQNGMPGDIESGKAPRRSDRQVDPGRGGGGAGPSRDQAWLGRGLQGTFLIPHVPVLVLEGRLSLAGAEPRALSRKRTEVGCGSWRTAPFLGGCCRKSSRVFPLVPVESWSVTALGNWVSCWGGWVILDPPPGVLVAPALSGQCPCWTRSSVI